MKEALAQRLAPLRRFQAAGLVLFLGLLLLLLPGGGEEAPTGQETPQIFDRLALQGEMERVLRSIEGVGDLRLMLMVDSDITRELAQDVEQSIDELSQEQKKETIVLGVGSGKQEVVVTRSIYPQFTGALVVCEGADNANVRYDVTTAVSVLTGLPSNRISVIKGNS